MRRSLGSVVRKIPELRPKDVMKVNIEDEGRNVKQKSIFPS